MCQNYAADAEPPERKTLRILHICACEQAQTYVNAIGGQALYDKAIFASYGVRLQFIQPRFTPYPQYAATFIAGLSIIDVLMHCGYEGTRRRLCEYQLL